MSNHADMIIVGAGLSGLLTAWRCLDVNSEIRITMIDAADKIGGDHTWSFNLSDVAPELRDWIAPFIAYQWPRYDVKFPNRKRTLDIPYCTGNSDTLRSCVQPHIYSGRLKLRLNSPAAELAANNVTLENGETLKAACVLDARGFEPSENVFLGYQKFVGHVIKTPAPHGLENPIIMDATVEQLGGYRFVYCLPYSETEMLVEDTYYTDGAELRSQEVDARIKDYIRDNLELKEYNIIRREKGVLPITLAVDGDARYVPQQARINQPIKLGIRGGYYHAVTGYSFPEAMKSANLIAVAIQRGLKNGEAGFYTALDDEMCKHERGHYSDETFLRLLNRMLFRAAKPDARFKVLQRFYGLNSGLIARFYAGQLTWRDKLRILAGKPPVPVTKALFNFSEKAFINRERARRESKTD